jgi:hypothetical protein
MGIAVTWYCSLLLTSLNGWDGNKYLRCAQAIDFPPCPCSTACVARTFGSDQKRSCMAKPSVQHTWRSPSLIQPGVANSCTCVRRYRDLSYSIWGPFGFYATILFQQACCELHLCSAAPIRSSPSRHVMCVRKQCDVMVEVANVRDAGRFHRQQYHGADCSLHQRKGQ